MQSLTEKEKIESLIYEIRGVQVMLDSDIAKLYQVDTKRINEAVKNNLLKFPERFSFILTKEEIIILRSKFSTANISSKSRTNPRVFTEQGLYMLATILKSKVATEVTIAVMDTFVKMRKYISKDLYANEKMLINHENRIVALENSFNKINEKEKTSTLFYEGQIYDAYSLFIDILNEANKEIIIIDNYAGKNLLDMLKSINKKIIIISKNIDEELIKRYQKQYSNIEFKYNNTFHDRFIILDKKIIYICGSSFKDIGKKCFYIGRLDNKEILNSILSLI